MWGTSQEDNENFSLLCRELKTAMDQAYGPGVKKLTACSGGAMVTTMPCQNWRLAAPWLDLINIMTYDLSGPWDGITGHASAIADIRRAVEGMEGLYGIPQAQICIGSPLYAKEFRLTEIAEKVVGAPCELNPPSQGGINQGVLHRLEQEAVSGYETAWENGRPVMGERYDKGGQGWHAAMEAPDWAPYLYNDDEASPYYRWFLSYENSISLQQKLDYILETNLAGIIIWECSEDTADHKMIRQMAENLLNH